MYVAPFLATPTPFIRLKRCPKLIVVFGPPSTQGELDTYIDWNILLNRIQG